METGDCVENLPILNLTNEISASAWLYTTSEEWFIKVLFPFTLFVGVLGNGAFLYVVLRVKRMHTITNYYLFNLGCADVVYVAFNTIGFIYTYAKSPVRYDTFISTTAGCYLLVAPIYAAYVASICLVTLVTLERYYGIVMPLKHRSINSKSRTLKLIGLSWFISICFGTSATLLFGKYVQYCTLWPDDDPKYKNFPGIVGFCEPLNHDVVAFAELCKVIPFFLALVWNGYMYFRILYSLSNRDIIRKRRSSGMEGAEDQMVQVRNQVARMLIVNGSIFFICQVWTRIASLDAICVAILGRGFLSAKQYNILLPFSRGMLFVNGTVNPFVYNATSPLYRQSFKEALFGWMTTKRNTEEISVITYETNNK